MDSRFVSKSIVFVITLTFYVTTFSQVNFFECAKNPAKCKTEESSKEASKSEAFPPVVNQVGDSKIYKEDEIRRKQDLEVEKKIAEDQQKNILIANAERERAQKELQIKYGADYEVAKKYNELFDYYPDSNKIIELNIKYLSL